MLNFTSSYFCHLQFFSIIIIQVSNKCWLEKNLDNTFISWIFLRDSQGQSQVKSCQDMSHTKAQLLVCFKEPAETQSCHYSFLLVLVCVSTFSTLLGFPIHVSTLCRVFCVISQYLVFALQHNKTLWLQLQSCTLHCPPAATTNRHSPPQLIAQLSGYTWCTVKLSVCKGGVQT